MTDESAVLHEGVICDMCEKPIRGVRRYKCANCFDYDLCSTCESLAPASLELDADTILSVSHSPSHVLFVLRRPLLASVASSDLLFCPIPFTTPAPAHPCEGDGEGNFDLTIHSHVVCDGCGSAIVGSRYVCAFCDFDLCGKCEKERGLEADWRGHSPESILEPHMLMKSPRGQMIQKFCRPHLHCVPLYEPDDHDFEPTCVTASSSEPQWTSYDVRLMTASDLSEVAVIEEDSFNNPWTLTEYDGLLKVMLSQSTAGRRVRAFVAVLEGRIAGYYVVKIKPLSSSDVTELQQAEGLIFDEVEDPETEGQTYASAWLLNCAVCSSFRRRGVGKALVNHLISFARGMRCCRIMLEVSAVNVPAQRLYASFGFVVRQWLVGYYDDLSPLRGFAEQYGYTFQSLAFRKGEPEGGRKQGDAQGRQRGEGGEREREEKGLSAPAIRALSPLQGFAKKYGYTLPILNEREVEQEVEREREREGQTKKEFVQIAKRAKRVKLGDAPGDGVKMVLDLLERMEGFVIPAFEVLSYGEYSHSEGLLPWDWMEEGTSTTVEKSQALANELAVVSSKEEMSRVFSWSQRLELARELVEFEIVEMRWELAEDWHFVLRCHASLLVQKNSV